MTFYYLSEEVTKSNCLKHLIDGIIFCYRYKTVATILYLIVGICPSLPLVFASVSMSYVTFPYSVLPFFPIATREVRSPSM